MNVHDEYFEVLLSMMKEPYSEIGYYYETLIYRVMNLLMCEIDEFLYNQSR